VSFVFFLATINQMEKFIILIISFFMFTDIYSQENQESKYEMAKEAYKAGDFLEADNLIIQEKGRYKSPPPKVLFLEIRIKAKILEDDLLQDYRLLENTRMLVNSFEKKYSIRIGSPYYAVSEIKTQLRQYPKDQQSFDALKMQLEREEAQRTERIAREQAEAKARKLQQEAEDKKRLEELELQRQRNLQRLEKERLEQEEKERVAQVERERFLEEQRKLDRLKEIEAEKQRVIQEKKEKRRLKSFTSLGFQGGEIAKYGLLLEVGGKAMGFRMAARSSLTTEEEVLSSVGLPNKTEIEIGPSIKVFKWFHLNFGGGYGFYNANIPNEYAGSRTIQKVGYVVTTGGAMIRLNRVININGGVAFMDIYKDVYTPEITAGISFNLRKNRK